MLLLAPQSGKKTRAKIQRKSSKLCQQTAETVADGVAQARAKAHDITTGIHKQAEELQQRGQAVLDEGRERASTAVEAGKTAVQGSWS
jgi:gas vesicle protein